MTNNPFHHTLDWALQGKYARVVAAERTYEGWVERVHHSRGSVVMHTVTVDGTEELGSVFVRTPDVVEVIKPQKRVEWRAVDELQPFLLPEPIRQELPRHSRGWNDYQRPQTHQGRSCRWS